MIFNTWTFAAFAIATLLLYWTVVPQRFKPHYLVVIGAIFYAFSVPAYLFLVVGLGCATYLTASMILRNRENPKRRKAWMVAGVTLIVGVLVLFKYTKFFGMTVNQLAHHNIIPIPQIIVPLAISFFTFEFVHVLVDVYLGKIESLDLLEFAVFTMFFPTLVAGPIKRYQSFAPQVRNIVLPDDPILALNVYRIVMGLAKKFIIADSMSLFTQPLITPDGLPYGRLDYVVAILAYTAKIYFDFTGYSDIAIGLGGMLGIKLPENFDRPYWSENVSVFWRRWHMSLSTWIRDYVFISMGGSRRPPFITMMNLLIAMAIAGLWHGAAWTFVAWGVWHGAGLAAHRLWSMKVVPHVALLRSDSGLVRAGSIVTTFAFVVAGWVLFAASSFGAAIANVYRGIL